MKLFKDPILLANLCLFTLWLILVELFIIPSSLLVLGFFLLVNIYGIYKTTTLFKKTVKNATFQLSIKTDTDLKYKKVYLIFGTFMTVIGLGLPLAASHIPFSEFSTLVIQVFLVATGLSNFIVSLFLSPIHELRIHDQKIFHYRGKSLKDSLTKVNHIEVNQNKILLQDQQKSISIDPTDLQYDDIDALKLAIKPFLSVLNVRSQNGHSIK